MDSQVMVIPVLAIAVDLAFAVLALVAWIFLIPVMVVQNATNQVDAALGVIIAVLFAITHVISQAAVMFAANERFEGRNPTVGGSLAKAFSKFGPLALFGLLEATVGLILRYIADNLKGVGNLIRMIFGLAWSVSTYFAIPYMIFENQGPIGSIGQSVNLIKAKWGDVLRGNVVASAAFVLAWLLAFGGFIGGILMVLNTCNDAGCTIEWNGPSLIGVSVLAFVLIGLASASVMAYVKVALYRFASNKPLPGFDSELLQNGFRTKL